MTAASVCAFALGLPAFMAVKVLVTACYAHKNTADPVRIAFIALIANVVLGLLFMPFLHHAGLSLATSLSSYLQVFLLQRVLTDRYQLTVIHLGMPKSPIVLALVLWSPCCLECPSDDMGSVVSQ